MLHTCFTEYKVYQVKNKDKVRRSNSQSSLSIEKTELKEGWYFLIKGVKEKISRYIFEIILS